MLDFIFTIFINTYNNHKSIDSEKFNEMYRQNRFNNINMENIIYQKLLVANLISDNRIHDYTDCQEKFKSLFPYIKFKITIDIYKKLKMNINGAVNNLNIEELCKTIPLLDKNINVEIYNINSDYIYAFFINLYNTCCFFIFSFPRAWIFCTSSFCTN